jgi:hypothetical protein
MCFMLPHGHFLLDYIVFIFFLALNTHQNYLHYYLMYCGSPHGIRTCLIYQCLELA